MDRFVYLTTAVLLAGYAVATQDWLTLAGTLAWLAVMRRFRWDSDQAEPAQEVPTSDDRLAGLRRWRSMLALFGLVALAVNGLAYERLAAGGAESLLAALLSTLLVAAAAAWLAWTQQEIRRLA